MATATRVPDLLRERASVAPGHVALVVDGGASLTYGAWEQRSGALARGLRARGVAPGDRVALLFDNARWTDYAVAYVGVLAAGAVAVPLSPRFSAAAVADVIEHAGAALVVRADDVSGLEATGREGPALDRSDEELAEIIYTSGTTGEPKGVACTHASILVHDLPSEAPRQPPSFLHAFPIGTNAGQECLRMPLRRQATATALTAFDPERMCGAIERQRIRALQLVPAMARVVVESGAPRRHDVTSVRRVTLSSAPAPPALWDRLAAAFPGASLWNAYALTEAGAARTLMRHERGLHGCVGAPVGDTEARVVDERGNDVPVDEVGEVWLRHRRSPRRWYHRDPAATAAAFAGDWLRTGDLGRLDEEGRLYIVDRAKDIVISGGLNISTVEVEAALQEHPSVGDAAVFGIAHPVLGEVPAAAVVLRASAGARELQAAVRARLGEDKVPRRVGFFPRLPRNASGKVLKDELRAAFGAAGATGDTPSDGVEARVAAIWQDVLGIPAVGAHDDFFALGGHSLAAVQIAARLEDAYGSELGPTAVFEHPTVAELAAAVAGALAR